MTEPTDDDAADLPLPSSSWPSPPVVHLPTVPSRDEARRLLSRYVPPPKMTYDYGTAGFRYEASLLPAAMVRVGMFAAVRSACLGGEEVGIMITASHNPVQDNGVKLADPDGGMLSSDWEGLAVALANASDPERALSLVEKTLSGTKGRKRMIVHIGRDTRPSSPALSSLAVRAALSLGAAVVDHGIVTTPQLHYCVMHANPHRVPTAISRRSDEGGYMESVCGSYAELVRTKEPSGGGDAGRAARKLVVDAACGVGAPKAEIIRAYLSRLRGGGGDGEGDFVSLEVVNRPGDGPLNDGCGAEFVQKKRLRPALYGDGAPQIINYGASLDGDADRVVFHYDRLTKSGGRGEFRLLDGDKIAALAASFVREEMGHLRSRGIGAGVKCGVVQTAYANGAATSYLRNQSKGDDEFVAIAKTGVKFVHAAAHDRFDVGVYFEANGHGTILFGHKYYAMLDEAERVLRGPKTSMDDRANVAWRRLRALPGLVNQAVGDALSDLLLVDAVLYLKGWTIEDWDAIYEDMPSRQCKVKVQDRSLITTNDNETRALSPSSLQRALDAAMAAAPQPARCFVRPSGTEDAVRVYAEAPTRRDADALADETAAIVHGLCGGVGEVPVTGGGTKARL